MDAFTVCCLRTGARLWAVMPSLLIVGLLLLPTHGHPETFIVTNTSDSGPGSLRAAIEAANASANTPHLIEFNIAGDGPHLIRPVTALPSLGRMTTIDASSEWMGGQPGIQLDGSSLNSGSGIEFNSNADGSSMDGLSITGFPRFGIISQADDVTIERCHVGVAPDGETAMGNGEAGISSLGDRAVIGDAFASGNLISGNLGYGIIISGGAQGSVIRGNRIGSNGNGSSALPNRDTGIRGDSGSQVVVGGSSLGQGNLISGNEGYGVSLTNQTLQWTLQGNLIGVDLSGAFALSNSSGGVGLAGGSHQVGGSTTTARNVVSGNQNAGILLFDNASNIRISGNFIGTDAQGAMSAGLQQFGIRAAGAVDGCDIGGSTAAEQNLISGNSDTGIEFSTATTGCQISGNRIGTNLTGDSAIPNGAGIDLKGTEHILGGSLEGEGNIISGNMLNGVVLGGSDHQVLSNTIGLNAQGNAAVPNGSSGIRVIEMNWAVIGQPGMGNLISGNLGSGISVDANSEGLGIRGNVIGLDTTGTVALGNVGSGLLLSGFDVLVGGDTADARNVISANGQAGITIQSDQTNIRGNYIGTDITGTLGLGNAQSGIRVLSGDSVDIGGLVEGQGNLVSGNGNNGITFEIHTAGVKIQQNRIGTNAAGTAAIPNAWNGLSMKGNDHQIGGVEPLAGNLISGNVLNGLVVSGSGFVIAGNRIGTNQSGFNPLGNGGYGVRIFGGRDGVLGGELRDHGNLISGNGRGVSLEQGTQSVSLLNNNIGLNLSEKIVLGNGASGIHVFANENVIGAVDQGNVIVGHLSHGIELDQGAQFNLVQGNWIGTNRDLQSGMGNGDAGVQINRGDNNLIGGLLPGEGNVIADNRLPAVRSGQGNGNEISGNSFFDNGFAGIDIGDFLVRPNDPLDPDEVGNRKQNFPLLFSASISADSLEVEVRLQNEPNTQYRVEFFNNAECDASGFGEGRTFIGHRNLTTDELGEAVAFYTFNQVTLLPFLTATVTDGEGNTSEFSPCLKISGDSAGQIQFFQDPVLAYEGVLPTARVIVTRSHGFTGTVSAEFTVSDDTALAGQDYSDTDQVVTFDEGESIKVIEIPLLVDPAMENSPEVAQLALASPTGGAVLGVDHSELLIFDQNPTRPGLIIEDAVLTEGQSGLKVFRFNVSLSATDHPVMVDFVTFDGSAVAGEDYLTHQGTLSFEPSVMEQQRSVDIEIIGDEEFEPDETFYVRILGRQGGGQWVAFDATATGLIRNDDEAPPSDLLFGDGFEG